MRLLGFRTKREFGWEVFRLSGAQTGRILSARELKPAPRQKLIDYLRTRTEVPAGVLELLETDLPAVLGRNRTSREKTGWEAPNFEPVEPAIFSWALSFRNSALLEETARQALESPEIRAVRSVQDGLILCAAEEKGARSSRKSREALQGLFPQPRPENFGLHAGAALMLGSARRHVESARLMRAFAQHLKDAGKRCEILQFEDRPSYFGYPSVCKFLRCGLKAKLTHPNRYAESESCMVYEDAAAIFHAPVHNLYETKKTPFGSASQLILVAALQRLANGIAVRLLTDLEFRKRHAPSHNFEEKNALDVFVFRVRVANDPYGTVIRLFQVLDAHDGEVLHSVPESGTW